MERPNGKNRIDQRIVDANIQLVDRNKLLEEDVSRLKERINKAIEYIEKKEQIAEQKFVSIPNKLVDFGVLEEISKILKGEYVEIE